MARAKWDYASAEEIRSDIRETYIKTIHNALDKAPDPIKIAVLEGMMYVYSALLPFTEETPDENVQNS
jgi:hypothetical protein